MDYDGTEEGINDTITGCLDVYDSGVEYAISYGVKDCIDDYVNNHAIEEICDYVEAAGSNNNGDYDGTDNYLWFCSLFLLKIVVVTTYIYK